MGANALTDPIDTPCRLLAVGYRELMGYLNTADIEQQKGADGVIR